MGTAMPSFKLLPQSEIEALVEYVEYLSLRGQTEIALINHASNELAENEEFPTNARFFDRRNADARCRKMARRQAPVTQVPATACRFQFHRVD